MSLFSRVRSDGQFDKRGSFWLIAFPDTCANRVARPMQLVAQTDPLFGEKTVTYDNTTEGYWKKRELGEWLPSHPFLSTNRKYEYIGQSSIVFTGIAPYYACTSPDLLGVYSYWGQWFTLAVCNSGKSPGVFHSSISGERMTNLNKEIITSCLAKRQEGDANYFESLAELDQVWAMVGSPLENGRKFLERFRNNSRYKELDRLRRKNPSQHHSLWSLFVTSRKKFERKRRKLARDARNSSTVALMDLISSEWLRFHYGMLPIVGDARAAMKTLSEAYDIGPKVHTARAMLTVTDQQYDAKTWSDASWQVDYQVVSTHEYSINACFHDRYSMDPFDKLGLTFRNVVGLPLELTRLSFVADWFVNISDLMYANIPRPNVEALGGSWFVVDKRTTVTAPVAAKYVSTTFSFSGAISDYVREIRTDKRRTILDRAQIGLVMRDSFRLTNVYRALDSAALLLQALRRIRV